MNAARQVSRYHPVLVALHWLLMLMIIGMLGLGFVVLDDMPNSDPAKIDILEAHMAVGMLILALMIVRLIVRLRTTHPPTTTVGKPSLDWIAPLKHYVFYVLVLLIVGTGYATGILAGLNRSVFGRSGEPLPSSFETYPTFVAHGTLALILAVVIALHLLASLYHEFGRKAGLFHRMWFGRRSISP